MDWEAFAKVVNGRMRYAPLVWAAALGLAQRLHRQNKMDKIVDAFFETSSKRKSRRARLNKQKTRK